MILIHKQLSDFYKSKRKTSQPKLLIELMNSLEKNDLQIHLSLNQKGIILELLAKICLNQFHIFAKALLNFKANLYGKNLDSKDKTTIKKKRVDGNRGNTTTIKRIKNNEQPQTVRNAIDLDEILQRQLNSPKNIEIRSQDTSNLSTLKQRLSAHKIQTLQLPKWQSQQQQFITPIKQNIDNNSQVENNLDIYRTLITASNKKKDKSYTKNKNTLKTRKKQYTQSIPEQINSFISLQNSSQLTLKKQIQDILEATKKKKNKEKQNLFYHETFKVSNENSMWHSLLQNKQNLMRYFKQHEIFKKQSLNNELYSQSIHHKNLLQQIYSYETNYQHQIILQQNQQEKQQILNQELTKNKLVNFDTFVHNLRLNKEEKSNFFYNLLCQSDKYMLNQIKVDTFGPIQIAFSKQKLF